MSCGFVFQTGSIVSITMSNVEFHQRGQFSPIAISIRLASFWMADLPAASPQFRLTREAAPMLKRSASHAFVTLVLCLATDATAIFSALPFGCFGKSAGDITK